MYKDKLISHIYIQTSNIKGPGTLLAPYSQMQNGPESSNNSSMHHDAFDAGAASTNSPTFYRDSRGQYENGTDLIETYATSNLNNDTSFNNTKSNLNNNSSNNSTKKRNDFEEDWDNWN